MRLQKLLANRKVNQVDEQNYLLKKVTMTSHYQGKKVVNRQVQRSVLGCLSLIAVLGIDLAVSVANSQTVSKPQVSIDKTGKGAVFSCNDTEATIIKKNGPKVTFGTKTIYIGYQQVGGTNQDPRIALFDKGKQIWCRSDLETTGDDGRGYGLLWDGKGDVYGVFSATGTRGANDFRRFAKMGWLTNYGNGGGPKAAIIARLNPLNGEPREATFITAVLGNGKTNSLVVSDLSLANNNLTVKALSWWSPRRANKTRMTCTGDSPFNYTLTFKPVNVTVEGKITTYYLREAAAASVTTTTKTNADGTKVTSGCS